MGSGMRDLTFDLVSLCKRNHDGSFATRSNRKYILSQISHQLAELGYRKMRAHDLKGRHIHKLLSVWEAQGLSTGTVKNRMAALRWWAEKIGKEDLLAHDNAHYGIPGRSMGQESRAVDLDEDVLQRIDGLYAERIRLSLRLQRLFGLRREESIKFIPSYAIRRDEAGVIVRIHLKASWTKGGRARYLNVRTEAQRKLLEEVSQLVRNESLIPSTLSYKDYLAKFEYRTRRAGLDRKHGLRHRYAQERYRELTGWECPILGGAALTSEQVARDQEVRDLISRELGHERRAITSAYLGTWIKARGQGKR
jgi:hypothetical protein